MKLLICTGVVLFSSTVFAEEQRFDHRGSVGLLVAGTVERKDAFSTGGKSDQGWRGGAELGGTLNVGGEGNELKVAVRTLLGNDEVTKRFVLDVALYTGYRGYFDLGQWKTFVDLDLASHFTPVLTFGPRVGFGVQLDFLPIAGAYAGLAAQIGFGDGIRYGAELMIGFQFRSYLLE